MNTKRNKFRFLKFLTYCLGFPAMCLTMIWIMAPAFNNSMYAKFGKICVAVTFLLWGIFEVVKILLKKLARKGSLKADVATFILVVVTLGFVVLPVVFTDLKLSKDYNAFNEKLGTQETVDVSYIDPLTNKEVKDTIVMYKGSSLPSYSKVMGWSVDNTSKGRSYLGDFANEVNGYISANKLAGFGNSEKGNSETKVVDYDINMDGKIDDKDVQKIGLKRGLYSDLDFKIQGKYNYTIISYQLNQRLNRLNSVKSIYAENIAKITARKIKIQQGETIEDPENDSLNENVLINPENGNKDTFAVDIPTLDNLLKNQQTKLDTFNKDHEKEIQELGGQRVRIYDDTIKGLLDIIGTAGEILPDGLNIELLGLDLPVGQIVKFLGDVIDGIGGLSPAIIDTIVGAVCSSTNDNPASDLYNHKYLEISLGMAQRPLIHKCAKTAEAKATENGYDYTATRALKDKISFYPKVLVFGRFRRVIYVFMGLLILSIFLSDHYTRKIKQIDNILFNTHTQKVLESKGYVLKSELEAAQKENETTLITPITPVESVNTPVQDVSPIIPTPINIEPVKTEPVKIEPLINNIDENVNKEETKEADNKANEVKDEKQEDIPRPQGIDLSAMKGGNDNERK